MIKRIIAAVALAALLLLTLTSCFSIPLGDILGGTSSSSGDSVNLSELTDAVLNSQRASVRIEARHFDFGSVTTSQGSGAVFLLRNGAYYALTNHHVLADDDGKLSSSVTVLDAYGAEYSSSVVAVSEEYDLGIVKFKKSKELYTVPLASENAPSNRTVYSIGTPEGLINAVTYGKIYLYSDIDKDELPTTVITHSCYVEHGSSGGGLFDAEGKLIGINYAYAESEAIDSRYAFAVPIEAITEFLVQNNLMPKSE